MSSLNNKGLTMLELIMTVAVITVFFTTISITLPRVMEQYILMKNTSEALEITSILENGMATELGGAANFRFEEKYNGLGYEKNLQVRYFPLNAQKSEEDPDYGCTTTLVNTGSEHFLTITGRPKIYGTLYDGGFYGNMTVKIELKYKDGAENMNVKITVFDAEGKSICVSEKPIVLYN